MPSLMDYFFLQRFLEHLTPHFSWISTNIFSRSLLSPLHTFCTYLTRPPTPRVMPHSLKFEEPAHAITADRLLSLLERRGDDDMFSSDLEDAELSDMLSPLGVAPCLILQVGLNM